MAIFALSGQSQTTFSSQGIVATNPCIPGAQGFGIYTISGRCGTVVRVTSLATDGAGTLRSAVQLNSVLPKIVIFDVSGEIDYTGSPVSSLIVDHPNVFIAGQTAPSPGITIRAKQLTVRVDDVVIQHIRFRLGNDIEAAPDASGRALSIQSANNVVIDHCSMSWTVDESFAAGFGGAVNNLTVSNCIISEPLHCSIHPKGCHGYGPASDVTNFAFRRNLLSHFDQRGPLLKDGSVSVISNNIFYDFGYVATNLSNDNGDPFTATVEGNVYIDGNSTYGSFCARLSSIATTGSQFYVNDNDTSESTSIDLNPAYEVGSPPVIYEPYSPIASSIVEDTILDTIGARPLDRDTVDARIIVNCKNRTGAIIDSQDDVGGFPTVVGTTRVLTLPDNYNEDSGNGYTILEAWLHNLAADLEGQSILNDSFELNDSIGRTITQPQDVFIDRQLSSNVGVLDAPVEKFNILNNYHVQSFEFDDLIITDETPGFSVFLRNYAESIELDDRTIPPADPSPKFIVTITKFARFNFS